MLARYLWLATRGAPSTSGWLDLAASTSSDTCCCSAAGCWLSFCCRSYEGATAAAMPEAVVVNQGGKRGNRKTVIANSMLTSSTAPAPKASRIASLASTAQPVGSLALSGEEGRAGRVCRCVMLGTTSLCNCRLRLVLYHNLQFTHQAIHHTKAARVCCTNVPCMYCHRLCCM
jgi:hypothetical protein